MSAPGRLRIIGGTWRGRKIDVPDREGLRPTPDRVRETLFNWLQAEIEGARCLDLFAGTGILGLEALSRGAATVTWVDRDALAFAPLRAALARLGAAGDLVQADAAHFLNGSARPYDVVFLDPPYATQLLAPCCKLLEDRGWLTPRAWIYLEQRESGELPALPANWELTRSRRAGQVGYHLALRLAA